MNILLTGANGFVGRATLACLLQTPDTAVSLALRTPIAGMPAHCQHPIESISGNTRWSHALLGVDTVIHLAARVHVMNDCSPDPLAEFRTVNVEGSLALARQAASAGVRRFVYISSIKVLGESTLPGQSFTEDSPAEPRDPYGISKWEAEQGLRDIADHTGLEVVILRPPLVYGPGVGANFQSLMSAVRRGFVLPLASVKNKRSMVSVENLANAICLCAQHPAAANQTFLVSDQEDLSPPQLVSALAKAMKRPARLLPVPVGMLKTIGRITGKSAAIDRLCGNLCIDSSKISRMLGWRPILSVADAMQQTVAGEGLT